MLVQPLVRFVQAEYLADLAPCAECAGRKVEIIIDPLGE